MNKIVRTIVCTTGIPVEISGFDWDVGNMEKCRKHGLSLQEIESLFYGTPAVLKNERHLSPEDRYHAIGEIEGGRYAYIVFTYRRFGDSLLIRPISARYMHQREIDQYERQKGA